MIETPFFFPGEKQELFGVLHEPARPDLGAFVFSHPFGEEKLWTHRVFVAFARLLAERGYAVLRFDFAGNGDSHGEFGETSLSSMRGDLRSAIQWIRERRGAQRVNLLGLRLGATIASLVADDLDSIERLVLWAPIVDGQRYMQDLLRVNLTTQLAVFREIRQDRDALVEAMRLGRPVNVDGYDLTLPLYSEVAAVRLAASAKRHQGPCLVTQIDRQPRPAPELRQLARSYPRATERFAAEEPFWKEIGRSYQRPAEALFSVSVDWLREA